MTTLFTCSTGLGDKCTAPLLRGLFRLQMMTSGIRAGSEARDARGGNLGGALTRRRKWCTNTNQIYNYPSHVSRICFYWLNIFNSTSERDFELAIPRLTFSTLSKYIKAHFVEILFKTNVHHAN